MNALLARIRVEIARDEILDSRQLADVDLVEQDLNAIGFVDALIGDVAIAIAIQRRVPGAGRLRQSPCQPKVFSSRSVLLRLTPSQAPNSTK
ncbi:hypothetical protein [Methylobacterium tardum]|uniref:hypothetical protein n=1 Tax=Methylobacterium tardum TaxID=374432 RepID=UPI00361EB569